MRLKTVWRCWWSEQRRSSFLGPVEDSEWRLEHCQMDGRGRGGEEGGMMWVDVPQIFLLSLFFGRKSRASTKNSARYQRRVGKFSSGLSPSTTTHYREPPLGYKVSKYQY